MEKIKFYADTHQYFYGERELTSVSKWAKGFEKKKDWDAIAIKYAKKKGGTKEFWQEKWKAKGEASTKVGTLLHEIREKELLDLDKFQYLESSCSILSSETIADVKYSLPIQDLPYNTVFPELMIYDIENGLCGQSDKVVVTDTHIHVLDYKTDKEINFKAFSSQWVKPEKFAYPIEHLDNCNGNMYALKMSAYMYMLWKQNKHLKPGKLILEHITLKRDEEGIPVLENDIPVVLAEEQIELPYLKKEVMAMIEHYNNQP